MMSTDNNNKGYYGSFFGNVGNGGGSQDSSSSSQSFHSAQQEQLPQHRLAVDPSDTPAATVFPDPYATSTPRNGEFSSLLGKQQQSQDAGPCCSRCWQGRLGVTCCWMVLLVQTAAIVVFLAHGLDYASWKHAPASYHATTAMDEPAAAAVYNYIVVGGGPAGILTAWKLARSLPDCQVLLLESGTASQASVLHNLREQRQEQRAQPERPCSNSNNSNCGNATTSLDGPRDEWGLPQWMNDQRVYDNVYTALVNKFDVPLLWSGVASDQGYNNIDGLGTATAASHHWPIERTLLGRALGGSGLHNAMVYVRALPHDVDVLWNVSGWSWEDLLPHYVALERYTTTTKNTATPFWNPKTQKDGAFNDTQQLRGTHGLVTTLPAGTASLTAVDAVAPLFIQSALHAGHRLASPGFNSDDPAAREGAGYYDFNIDETGVRDSIAHALLGGISSNKVPPNLVVKTGITVTRVLTEPSSTAIPPSNVRDGTTSKPRAIGVEYVQELANAGSIRTNERHRSRLTTIVGRFLLRDPSPESLDEVILAAGCILTPQLLFNSGMGDGGTVADLPGVGKNVQDHPVIAMAYQLSPDLAQQASSIYTVADEMQDYLLAVSKLQQGATKRPKMSLTETSRLQQGLGTFGTAGLSSGAFFRSPWATDASPDLQVTVFPRVIEPHVTRQQKMDHDRKAFLRSSAMQVTVALLRPEARYEVRPSQSGKPLVPTASTYSSTGMHVDRKNPLAKALEYRLPSIDLPANTSLYLTSHDVKRIAWGMDQVREIFQTPPLSEQTLGELYPGSNVTDRDLHDYIHDNNLPNSHWVGSTRMGADDDPTAVVDEKLRVRGAQGLRIVDSGVIPAVPNGNTHSTVCVVASRAADLIVEARKRSDK